MEVSCVSRPVEPGGSTGLHCRLVVGMSRVRMSSCHRLCLLRHFAVIVGNLLIPSLLLRLAPFPRPTLLSFDGSETSRKLMIQLGGRSYIRFSLSLVFLGNLSG